MAKSLYSERSVPDLLKQEFDQLLAHQHCVRRLFLHFPDVFSALRKIRSDIENVLADTELVNEPILFRGSNVSAVARSMRALGSKEAKNAIKSNDFPSLRFHVAKEIQGRDERVYPILFYIDESQLDEICDVLARSYYLIESFSKELNFFDIYDPFSLTCFAHARNILEWYYSAKNGLFKISLMAEKLNSDHHWKFVLESELGHEMAAIMIGNSYLANRPISNVKIFGHDQHQIKIDGFDIKNHLILAVPTDKAPVKIDSALRDFRIALINAFIDEKGSLANIDMRDLSNSLFMKNYDEKIFLANSVNSYKSILLGLWVWDMVNPQLGPRLTVDESLEKVFMDAESLFQIIAPDENIGNESTHKNGYDKAVKIIRPSPRIAQIPVIPSRLDEYLNNGQLLGRRTEL